MIFFLLYLAEDIMKLFHRACFLVSTLVVLAVTGLILFPYLIAANKRVLDTIDPHMSAYIKQVDSLLISYIDGEWISEDSKKTIKIYREGNSTRIVTNTSVFEIVSIQEIDGILGYIRLTAKNIENGNIDKLQINNLFGVVDTIAITYYNGFYGCTTPPCIEIFKFKKKN